MNRIVLFLLLIGCSAKVLATHIIGGEMRYEYLGPGSVSGTKQYKISLLLLRGPTGATFINQYIVAVYDNGNNQKILGTADNNNWAAVEDFFTPLNVPIIISPCIQNPPNLQYTYKTYSFTIELPVNARGYTVAFQTYSRQTSNNVIVDQGANYSCIIPGTNMLAATQNDNSPKYKLPVSVICENSPFTLDFSADDQDGDSLVYQFCDAYDGGGATLADYRNTAPPPYLSVTYVSPYTGLSPMGAAVTINPQTGIISGRAPGAGRYVICVCASMYRNGVLIGIHRKDLIVEVSACIPLTAVPDFNPITCDGFNVTFAESSSGNPTDFRWDFGDPASGVNNTSTLPNPTHLYTTAGIYQVKLVVSISGQCIDSVTQPLAVFPGFFPGFSAQAPFCVGQPIQFTDTTRTNYGFVSVWSWNFGDPTTLGDTSHIANPQYTYNVPGSYQVRLISGNSKGCVDTAVRIIQVNPSPVVQSFPRDTSYCALDSIQLRATGTGTFNWQPNSRIIGANTATPVVFPVSPTKYYVTLTSPTGCTARDSVTVNPLNDLTNTVSAIPSAICQEDSLQLTGTSNHTGVSWQWTPAATLRTPAQSQTIAIPNTTTTYNLRTTWGKNCVVNKSITIPVTPLAVPNAGPDATICNGQTQAQLSASGGNSYSWSPVAGLSNPNIANPVANPSVTTRYIVSVGVTGCPKTKNDTVLITVNNKPVLNISPDTLICSIDTLQLNAAGTGAVTWSPAYMINNINSHAPLVSPDTPTRYFVRLIDGFRCFTDSSVFVDVKPFATVNAGPDTVLCRGDGYVLKASGDALQWSWTPPASLDNPAIKNPFARPLQTTTYTLTGNIGKCQSTSSVTVEVVPYPQANAGSDVILCEGNNIQLMASGGSMYSWTPLRYLTNPNIADPVVNKPTGTLQYIVKVTDTLGCPVAVYDTVIVTVIPRLMVDAGPPDTNVVEGQALVLHGTGAVNYLWTPDRWLSATTTANPVSRPQSDITYLLTGSDNFGCQGTDSIRVHVYTILPGMYVPTAFTPNKDGLNDVIRPTLIGMKSLIYFRVYNRFGEMVFTTTEIDKGWDGIYKGKGQDSGTFVWMAQGETFKGELLTQKGYVVLIR